MEKAHGLGDLNGNGIPDSAERGSQFLNKGFGQKTFPTTYTSGSSPIQPRAH